MNSCCVAYDFYNFYEITWNMKSNHGNINYGKALYIIAYNGSENIKLFIDDW